MDDASAIGLIALFVVMRDSRRCRPQRMTAKLVAHPHHAVTRVKPDDLPKERERRPFEFDMNSVYFFDPVTGANIETAANALRAR